MRIESVRIENFRSIKDETIELDSFTALVGPNGSGKSATLGALNAFFGYKTDGGYDCSMLDAEDFHLGDCGEPVRITVTFSDLGDATADLAHYVRNEKLVVTGEASFDQEKRIGKITHFGQRLGLPELSTYFDAEKAKASAADLKVIFQSLRETHPDIEVAKTKDAMREALLAYEESLDESALTLIPSEDSFYGSTSTSGKLRPYIEWVYVPAVKDASAEASESEGPAIRALVARAISNRSDLNKQIDKLKTDTRKKLVEILASSKEQLEELAGRIEARLQTWSKPDARVGMDWKDDGEKSVKLADPQANVQVGDVQFMGELSRQGHGLQRSYLLAILEELSHNPEERDGERPPRPTLILGIEEPELYQHPPQARRLSSVLERLSEAGDQVIITTHSPYFVHGEKFEHVRLVRRPQDSAQTKVHSATVEGVFARVKEVHGEDTDITLKLRTGAEAKLHQALTPALNEMFFCPRIVFVEGQEDVAYILSWIAQTGKASEFLASEFEVIPCLGKSNMILPAAVAEKLGIPTFFVFDGDTNLREHKNPGVPAKHRRDNGALANLCGAALDDGFPNGSQTGERFQIWDSNIGATFEAEMRASLGDDKFDEIRNKLLADFGHAGDLDKNTLFVEALVERCIAENGSAPSLDSLCEKLCASHAVGEEKLAGNPA